MKVKNQISGNSSFRKRAYIYYKSELMQNQAMIINLN